jgi:hypothetical protein
MYSPLPRRDRGHLPSPQDVTEGKTYIIQEKSLLSLSLMGAFFPPCLLPFKSTYGRKYM